MNTLKSHIVPRLSVMAAAAAVVAAGFAPTATRADDTEALFIPPDVVLGDAPNILFVLDTSATMATYVAGSAASSELGAYSYLTDYTQLASDRGIDTGCERGMIYWRETATDPPTTCQDLPAITTNIADPTQATPEDTSRNKVSCRAVQDYFLNHNEGQKGFAVLQFRPGKGGKNEWGDLVAGLADNTVDCWGDNGVHGINATSASRFLTNTGDGYSTSTKLRDPRSPALQLYSGNYIAYTAMVGAGDGGSRIDLVKDALFETLSSAQGVNVGLMRIANNGRAQDDPLGATTGGMVVHEVASVASGGLDSIRYTLYERTAAPEACTPEGGDLLDPNATCRQVMIPGGRKAIGETLYEAYRYLSGSDVVWGDQTKIHPNINFLSVPGSLVNPDANSNFRYKSPITNCGRTYLVLLSDGLTTQDRSNDTAIANLPNFRNLPGVANPGRTSAACDPDEVSPNTARGSDCVDDLPGWMWLNDVNTSMPGIQNVKTFTIGFDLSSDTEGQAAEKVLRDAALRGGGKFFNAKNKTDLRGVFEEIFRRVLFENSVFTAPAVTVNAFNRTQNLESLFFSVFKPNELSYRWIGNLKKYRLDPTSGVVVDADGAPAVDISKGFFTDGSRSFWSEEEDGSDAAKGGAASRLIDPAGRTIYYNTADTNDSLTELSALKTASDAEQILFGGTPAAGAPTVDELVDWAYGFRVPTAPTEARRDMGDPLHSRPAAVIYGGSAAEPDTTVYVTTNDGMLQAVDADTGDELWAFMPRQLARRLPDLYTDDGITQRVYGLDGSIRVYRKDENRDGTIDPADGDRVYLYVGMRRGGQHYFGLDVSDRANPRLMWRIGAEDADISTTSDRYLPDVGQTWSTPTVARVNIDRSWSDANPDKIVLVFGGGFDTSQDALGWSAQTRGNGLYMVDAVTGELIWRASGPAPEQAGADLYLSGMTQSVVADVAVADLGNDGFTDRMYASDLGGRVWRFDIINGSEPSALVKGGLFASVGLGETTSAPTPDPSPANRRFYFGPDIAIIECGGRRWVNVALGSGNRERPVSDDATQNRFYSLRDPYIFTVLENDDYQADCSTADPADGPCHQIIRDDDLLLADITGLAPPSIPANAVGWKLSLSFAEAEKVLAESRTFESNLLFSTYSPTPIQVSGCNASFGLNRLYAISVCTALPVWDNNRDGQVSGVEDLYAAVPFAGIAPEVVVVFPPCTESGAGCWVTPRILLGPVPVGSGEPVRPVRTFWRQEAVR